MVLPLTVLLQCVDFLSKTAYLVGRDSMIFLFHAVRRINYIFNLVDKPAPELSRVVYMLVSASTFSLSKFQRVSS